MKIEIVNTVIEIHFLYEKEYIPFFSSYIVEEGTPALTIFQDVYAEDAEKGDLKIESKYYDLYLKDDQEIQYQKEEVSSEIYNGKIIYGSDSSRFSAKDVHDVNSIILLIQYIVTRYLTTHNDCILMHGSSIAYNGKGIIFTAPSGTGKSTHSALWKKFYDVIYINDDKNYLVKENDKLMLYGNPWSGKHHLDNNIIVPLNAVVFLYQEKENSVRRLNKREAFLKLMGQVVTPQSESEFPKWNAMIDSILELPCYSLGCTISKEAVDIIKNEIEKEN